MNKIESRRIAISAICVFYSKSFALVCTLVPYVLTSYVSCFENNINMNKYDYS